MIEIKVQERIPRPPEEVFRYIADFENNPKWQGGMQSARFTSEGPLGKGSTYDQVARFLGREIHTGFEVVEWVPDRSITIESRSGPFPIRVTRAVEATDEGALVTAEVSGDPTGFFKLWKPLMQAMVKRSVTEDYRRLRELLTDEH